MMRPFLSRTHRLFLGLVLLVYGAEEARTQSPVAVTLLPTTTPAVGEPGITSITVIGSNFPSGSILPANVTVTLTPATGGAAVNTTATGVTTIAGSTRRLVFTIPASIMVATATPYNVSISGSTASGVNFASSNTAALTVDPGASLSGVNPSGAPQGQAISVTISGQFTNFVQGATQASFGAGVSVGGGAAGAFGPVTVASATSATASLAIASTAALGARSVMVQTGTEQVSLANGFTVTPGIPVISQISPSSAQQGQALAGVVITGAFTHFTQGAPVVTFSNVGVVASAVTVTDNTHLTVTLTIAASAATGTSNVTVVTGSETAAGTNLFSVSSGTPVVTQVSPAAGQQGQSNLSVTITGAFTHFSTSSVVTFANGGVTAGLPTSVTTTSITVPVSIMPAASLGATNLTVTTGAEVVTLNNGFTVNAGTPVLTQVNPNTGQQGQTLASVAVTGQLTHFVQGTTVANFGAGITVNSTTVANATSVTANITIAANAPTGPRTVTMTTGTEVASLSSGFNVNAVGGTPTITDFNPKSAPIGTLITLTGTNLQPNTGTAAQFTLAKQGSGTVTGFATTASATSLNFVVPAGAATGIPSVTLNSQNASAATALTIVPSSTFTVSAAPGAANLIQGQSVGFAVSLSSTSGFDGLAALSVSGVPTGVTAAFEPQSITAGQTSVLTLTAPGNQPITTSALTITAAATVSGLPVTQTAKVSVSVIAPTTSFLGRTVVSDSLETPLAGVTITMLGKDGNGNTTGCIGGAVSDGGGNFLLTNLPPTCVGPQLVGFNGTTVTSPPGTYASVNLVFTFADGQVTASPVLVHLPRIDNVETFLVTQNSSVDQTHAFTSIPGLSVTVYAGTTFTLQDGTQPNPFPLAAVQVPVDRLPDAKPFVPTMMRAFIVAFQPANATTNEPVAVYFPNILNTPPGTDMALMTLDPTHGQMVPYGTGAVSSDGTQIVPDPDPAHPGHLYGLIHFDWHGPMPPPPPTTNPGPPGGGAGTGGPASGPGPGPGGGSGPGGGNGGNNGGGGTGGTGGGTGGNGGGNGGGTGGGGGGSCSAALNVIPTLFNAKPAAPAEDQEEKLAIASASDALGGATAPCGEATNAIAGSVDGGPAEAGDPVDLFSGIQVLANTDISISGARGSLSVVRTYRSLSGNPGPFGIGTGLNYGLQLDVSGLVKNAEGIINLVMPDGNQYPFYRTVAGTFINTAIPAFAGAVMSNPASGVYDLRYKNGATFVFQTSALGGLEAFLTAITDSNGNTVTITLNPSQPLQVTQVTDPVGRSLVFSYDSSNRITLIIDPIGRSVQYTYNSQGALSTVTDPAGGVTRYTYDSQNNLLTLTDPRGIVQAQNTLDANGRVIQQLRPDGGILSFAYVPLNPLAATSQMMQAQVTDSKGVQVTYRFNPNGFVTDVAATNGEARHIQRSNGTNLLTSVTESFSTTTYTYDGNGNILSSTDATGLTTQFTYEPVFNKVTSISDPLGYVTRFTYDGNGNLLTSTDANGNISSYQYDSLGLLAQSTDALNQKTTFTYDGLGNLISTTDPLGNTTAYAYDAISRLIQTTDSLGRRTVFTYDPLDRLLTRTDAKTGLTQFAYDPDGNLLSVKDARSNTATFTYDVMNRLATRTDPLAHSDTRTYDTNGNLVTFIDRRGQTSSFTYDNLNRLTGESYSDGTVARSYDVLGRLAQVNDSAAGAFDFSYDPAGRLLSSSMPVGIVDYTFDGRGLMESRQVTGQSAVSYTYDPVGNLASAALPQASASFIYNARNQLANLSRLNGVSSAFGYDPDARLLTLTHAAGATAIDAESYTYDATGNRAGRSTSIGQSPGTQPTTNQYNANNQLTLFGSVPLAYDANGNLIQEGNSTSYAWDGRNRLKSIMTAAGQTTNFTYDFAGNLIIQADTGSSLNLTKSFVPDNLTNIAYEAASDGTSYSVLSGQSIDSHLAIAQSTGQVQYGLTDAINSTVVTTDQSGAIKAQFLYDPFGQTTTTSSYPFQFTGRTPVSTTAYYYRARFYNAVNGRFISEDPIGFRSGPNFYAYVRNNPVGFTDPSGLICTYSNGRRQCVVTEPGEGGPGSTAGTTYSDLPITNPTPLPSSETLQCLAEAACELFCGNLAEKAAECALLIEQPELLPPCLYGVDLFCKAECKTLLPH